MRDALTAALAHLPAGSEAVKPVGEVVELTGSLNDMQVIRWASGYCPSVGTKLFTAPPSTPPAANVQEIEDEAVYEAADAYAAVVGHSPSWEGIKAVLAFLRSKQAPTIAVKCAICGNDHDNDMLSDICVSCEEAAPWQEQAPTVAVREAVERVARVLCGHFGESYDNLPENVTYLERKTVDRAIMDRSEAREIAEAAIAEVMAILGEPTTPMIAAGWKQLRRVHLPHLGAGPGFREAFTAALSASPLSQGWQE